MSTGTNRNLLISKDYPFVPYRLNRFEQRDKEVIVNEKQNWMSTGTNRNMFI